MIIKTSTKNHRHTNHSNLVSYKGYIHDSTDAMLLVQACYEGIIHPCERRLSIKERHKLIQSGSIFIFNERDSGIKRWTDGLTWSPSRISGNFLVYRQVRLKQNAPKAKTITSPVKKIKLTNLIDSTNHSSNGEGEFTAGSSNTSAAEPLINEENAPESDKQLSEIGKKHKRSHDDSSSEDTYYSDNMSTSLATSPEMPAPSDRPFKSSKGVYFFMQDGLVKKTMSVWIPDSTSRNNEGVYWHIVSYFNPKDVRISRDNSNPPLVRPSDDHHLSNLRINITRWGTGIPDYGRAHNSSLPKIDKTIPLGSASSGYGSYPLEAPNHFLKEKERAPESTQGTKIHALNTLVSNNSGSMKNNSGYMDVLNVVLAVAENRKNELHDAPNGKSVPLMQQNISKNSKSSQNLPPIDSIIESCHVNNISGGPTLNLGIKKGSPQQPIIPSGFVPPLPGMNGFPRKNTQENMVSKNIPRIQIPTTNLVAKNLEFSGSTNSEIERKQEGDGNESNYKARVYEKFPKSLEKEYEQNPNSANSQKNFAGEFQDSSKSMFVSKQSSSTEILPRNWN